jgi:multidrug efflux system membrane fusion protein
MLTKPAERATETVQTGNTHEHQRLEVPVPAHPPARGEAVESVHKSSLWGWLIVLALVGSGWYFRANWLPWLAPLFPNGAAPSAKKEPKPIPVRTATAQERDMPLYLNGLGTVTAFKTVTLHSRVDGELIKVAFTEGQMVREGDLLAQIDPRPFEVQLGQAEGQLARDEATLKLAKLNVQRSQDLLRSRSIAQQQVDEAQAQMTQTEGMIKTDQALVDNAKLQLTYCRIIAPISGRIGLRLVDQGNIVHANDLMGMAVITQLQPIALVFTIPQDDIPRLQKQTQTGQTLTVDAYDRDFKNKLATGTLLAVDNQVDSTTGTVRLKAQFENEDGMLFPNQFVNARLLLDVRRGTVVVPAAAVQRGPTSMFVYVVGPDDKAELREVITGPTEAAETAIDSGLVAGEVVVTDGIDKLQKGAVVTTRDKETKGDTASKPPVEKTEAPAANTAKPHRSGSKG